MASRESSSVKHLGHLLRYNLSESEDVTSKRGDLFGRTNCLVANFWASPPEVLNNIYNSQCAHLYGASAWDLCDNSVKLFSTAWNRCVRRIHGLPTTTHCALLPQLVGRPAAIDQIHLRICGMYETIQESNNPLVTAVLQLALDNPHSIAGGNKWHIKNNYQTDTIAYSNIRSIISRKLQDDIQSRIVSEIIIDCLNVVKGYYELSIDNVDVNNLVIMLCTS